MNFIGLLLCVLCLYLCVCCFVFFKQKTAYDMRISDWSSDVCSSDLELFEQQKSEGYRALRLPVDLKAILATNQGSHAIDLVNISQSGAGFRSAIPLEAGALVNLVLPNDEKRRPALVRWARGLCGGLWFTQPIERSLLASIDRLRLH